MKKMIGFGTAAMVSAAILGAIPAALAHAASAAPVVQNGTCSGPSTWTLTLKHDAGRIESDLEVQSPLAGQIWHYRMTDNGLRFASGNRTTKADGSFSVTRYAINQAGTDNIVARSKNITTGEVCTASASI